MKAPLHLASIASVAAFLAGCAPQMAMTSTMDTRPEWEREPRPVPVELPRIVPIPEIPAALRGCWDSIPPDDPDEPGGPHRLVITATTVAESSEGSTPVVATAEYVTEVTPTLIEGLFSYPDRHGRATLVTMLRLGDGGSYGSPDTLTRAEGDAGSSAYTRCKP